MTILSKSRPMLEECDSSCAGSPSVRSFGGRSFLLGLLVQGPHCVVIYSAAFCCASPDPSSSYSYSVGFDLWASDIEAVLWAPASFGFSSRVERHAFEVAYLSKSLFCSSACWHLNKSANWCCHLSAGSAVEGVAAVRTALASNYLLVSAHCLVLR